MSRHIFTTLVSLAVTLATGATAAAADYRGMSLGWPAHANGAYAAYYPQTSGGGPAYYVARPNVPAYAAARPAGMAYVPVRAAYVNPTYYAAYNAVPGGYRAAPASYAPTAAYYAPQPAAAHYAPVRANYAPSNSYAATPAGIGATGSEPAAAYAQPAAVNYVPPRFAYRTTYAPVPVYMYRPVTAYNPVTAQYSTCQQACTTSTCQPQRTSCFSWLNPFTWFRHGSCGSSGCGPAPAPTTAYCGTGCAQPYYPAPTTIIPAVPAPANTLPPTMIYPAPAAPPAGPVIPSPPTRFQNVPGAIPRAVVPQTGAPGFGLPADTPPSLAPQPGTTIVTPGTQLTPGGSFPVQPGAGAPVPGFTPTPGAFGTGRNYPPAGDPYNGPSSPVQAPPASSGPALNGPREQSTGPSHSVFGSGFKNNVIRAPELGPAMPPNVTTVPDLNAERQPLPVNRAPQLLDPRDKTAAIGRDPKWGVVPAKWPSVQIESHQQAASHMASTRPMSAKISTPIYDDSGWKSAR